MTLSHALKELVAASHLALKRDEDGKPFPRQEIFLAMRSAEQALATENLYWATIPRTAEVFGVTKRTVYNWITEKKVPVRRNPGGSIRIGLTEEEALAVPLKR